MIGLPEVPTFQYTMACSGKELAERSSDEKLAVNVGQAAADLLGSQELADSSAIQLEVGSNSDETQRWVRVDFSHFQCGRFLLTLAKRWLKSHLSERSGFSSNFREQWLKW
jgi:hypothetical protein